MYKLNKHKVWLTLFSNGKLYKFVSYNLVLQSSGVNKLISINRGLNITFCLLYLTEKTSINFLVEKEKDKYLFEKKRKVQQVQKPFCFQC